jgi:thiol-disulfide isomerase/thioredoxin
MDSGMTRRTFMAATALAAAGLAFRAALRGVAGQGEAPVTPEAQAGTSDDLALAEATAAVDPALRRTVLCFIADWCVLSQRALPFVTRMQAAYENAVNVEFIDIETPDGRELGLRHQIPFIPAFVVLDAAGAFDVMYYSPAEVARASASLLAGGSN